MPAPWTGHNAIHEAGQILARLSAYTAHEVEVEGLVYREGLSAVGIRGGVAGNVVPDECVVTVNYRFAPTTSVEQALDHLREVFAGYAVVLTDAAPGARPGLDQPAAEAFLAVVGEPPTAEVRLDRRVPVQCPRGARGQLRPGRPEPRAPGRRALPGRPDPALRGRAQRLARRLMVAAGADARPRGDLLHAVTAGVVTSLVGFTGAFAVVLAGLRAVGASPGQAASGLLTVTVLMGVCSLLLSVWKRLPVVVAWSTPGAALLVATGSSHGGWPAAVGAFFVCGVLLALVGVWSRWAGGSR